MNELVNRAVFGTLLCALAACSSDAEVPAPVEIVDLVGLEARIAGHNGRPLLLNFWAMW